MPYRTHVTLTYNVTGQEVEFYPPAAEVVLSGYATSAATYTVFGGSDSNDATAKFSGTATLDSPSTTVNAASGYSQTNRRRINLTLTTGAVVGRQYVVGPNAAGQREIITPVAVTSTYVDAEYDLAYDYASGNVFRGLRHYFTVDSTFIQDVTKINGTGYTLGFGGSPASDTLAPPYRVRWTYTAGGQSRQFWTYFDVARQAAKHAVSIDDIVEVFPEAPYQEALAHRGQDFRRLIDAGWRQVQLDVRLSGYDVDAIREGPILDELVLKATLWKMAQANIVPPGWDLQTREQLTALDYKSTLNRALGPAVHVWIDTGSGGGISPQPAGQLWLDR